MKYLFIIVYDSPVSSIVPNDFKYHPHLSGSYYLDKKHRYVHQCVPTQQDGSSTGRHSVFDVKLFTHLGPHAALELYQPSCRSVDRCRASVRQVSCRSRGSRVNVTLRHVVALCRAERSRERTDERRDTLLRERSEVSLGTRGDGSHGETVTRYGQIPETANRVSASPRRQPRALPLTQIHSAIPKNYCSQLC